MRKIATLSVALGLTVAVGVAGLLTPVGTASAKDNVFPGSWLSSDNGDVALLLEGREGYCLGFSSASVDLAGFDDDGDGLIDEDPFDGLDNDLDGLVDEDTAGFGSRARIYMTHGFSATSGDSDDVRVYDIEADVWLNPAPIPPSGNPRSEGAGVDHGGLIYCLGGRFIGVLDLVEAYDPTSNSWTVLSPMPTPRAGLAVAGKGSRIYAIGGRTGGSPCSGQAVNVAEVYDIPSDSWTAISAPPIPVSDATAVAHGGRIFLIGGCTGPFLGILEDAVQIYDPQSDSWSTGALMPTARHNLALGVLGNTIYAIGGESAGNLDVVEAYDIDKDVWTAALTSKPNPSSENYGVSHGGKIYVPGSGIFGAAQAFFEVFKRK
jgi:N-acetylneuraminic acid mutarotase